MATFIRVMAHPRAIAPYVGSLRMRIASSSPATLPNSCGVQLRNCFPVRGTRDVLRIFTACYRGVQARRSEYSRLPVLPYAGPSGILGISLPLKGSSRRTQLIAYTKCLCTCRCGDQWLGDRTVTRWRRRLAGFALYSLPSGAREAPPAVILSLA